ncbi:ABC transporter permease [Weissella koreensis]|uniref:ABC transporter permease n=1 Tax=Weissella koreensis TaxID=165096 RepID=A0A7H1MLI8_9LACO|nr:ABC transporter permease [Weissella koreensis]AVH75120.1 ABC transporter permease [Weissella koreensis]EJF33531.1 hypothetical protein JC2156_08930 [Weissella koreensis KCTC 3621]QGN20346.1 FtsX-like permease family protein [Weissella koreensis]QNT64324.1 ABC transporter permease [Weissella koreensis]
MNFIKRAGLTLWARKGRTILLTIVASVILIFVMAGLIIQNAALSSAKIASDSVGSTVTLSADREKMFDKMRAKTDDSSNQTSTATPAMTVATTTVDKVKQMAALSNVSSYNITNSASVNASGFKTITSTTKQNQNLGDMSKSSSGDITISGTITTAGLSGFKTKTDKITSGRGIKASDVDTNNVVVETELALANSIKVGDQIKVTNIDDSSKTKTLKIVGIYKSSEKNGEPMTGDPANTIYGSYTLANTLAGTENKVSNVTFNMTEPAKTKQFVKDAKKILDDSNMELTSDESSYKTAAKNMENVAKLASKIVWVVSIAGVLILGLIILLLTRERRREIGILVSLGESKIKVVGQLFTELLIILVVALGVATAVGTAASNKVGQTLVNQQQTNQIQNKAGGAPGGGGQVPGKMAGNKPIGDIGGGQVATQKNVNLKNVMTPSTIAELGSVAILIAFLSVSGGAIMILKLKPKQILQDD